MMFLIVGCGFLGSCVADIFTNRFNRQVIATVRSQENAPCNKNVKYLKCDVTDVENILAIYDLCKDSSIDVLYLASMHQIDAVYKNPEQAGTVNLDALKNFFNIFKNINRFIYASTDCVYGESINNHLFKEDDVLSPVNEYGRQKLQAEKEVTANGGHVVRLPFMFGPTPSPKKSFYDVCVKKLLSGEKIKMMDGFYRSALTYYQAAEFIAELFLLPKPLLDIINVCGDETLSKYDIGCRLAKKLSLSDDLIIKEPVANSGQFYIDKRAMTSLMDNSLLKSILNLEKIHFNL
ncbi:MAG: sugar nucleotide-binding protein [Acutalibacteraceae bacterium]